jgi:hypothetical protein
MLETEGTTMQFAALLPLNHVGRYIHWHFINISVANAVVMVLMVSAFVVAVLAPFPARRERGGTQ